MNFGNLLHALPRQQKKIIRNCEKTKKKLNNAKCALVFNKCCIKENLLPTNTNIYLYKYIFFSL